MAGLLAGVLPWVLSKGNQARNKLSGLLSDPIGQAEQSLGLLADSARNQNALMAAAFANPRRPFQVTDKNALTQASMNLLTGPLGFAPAGITAWHGSPHVFDRFDSSKIGTGEGAQAYGHGLYLAEAPDVAKGYAAMSDQNPTALQYLSMWQGDKKKAAEAFSKDVNAGAFGSQMSPQTAKDIIESINGKGSLYKVDLPDSMIARMLDWDKPLSQQASGVKSAIKRTRTMLPPNAIDDLGGDLSLLYGRDVGADSFLGTMNSLQPNLGETLLRKSGIPGIRYLDGGSRGAGAGSSNFVVFPGEENMLRILERNGQPIR